MHRSITSLACAALVALPLSLASAGPAQSTAPAPLPHRGGDPTQPAPGTPAPAVATIPNAPAAPSTAQTPAARPASPAPAAAPAHPAAPAAQPGSAALLPTRPHGQLANVRVEVTVSDQVGTGTPVAKTLSVTVADGDTSSVRYSGEVPTPGSGLQPAAFSLDAWPRILDGGRLRLQIGVDYNVVDASSERGPKNQVRFRQEVILESGRPLVISQSSDPMSDRKVTVEVKATIMK